VSGERRELLLILDGCERGTAGLAPELHRLLTVAPQVRVLATSRESLGVYGERLFRVAPLPTPRFGAPADPLELEEYPAVALFVQRARAVDPTFTLTADNADTVAELCTRLDGLPLAIELCAGRLRLFSLATLLAKVRAGNTVLTGGHVAAHPRQRSLTAAIDWSYEQLNPRLRQALDRLSACHGGFDLHAVEELCELTPEEAEQTVEVLVDRSLIVLTEHSGDGPWFTMLRTMAAHCQDRLAQVPGALEAARDRHAAYFAALARTMVPALDGSDQATALGWLRMVHGDLLAALAHLGACGRNRAAAQLSLDLHRYLLIGTFAEEGLRLLDTAAEQCTADDPLLAARVRDAAGLLAASLGSPAAAAERHEQALSVLARDGDPADAMQAQARLGAARLTAGQAAGRDLAESVLPELEKVRPAAAAAARLVLADVLVRDGDSAAADNHATAALAAYRRSDDAYGQALALRQAAAVAYAEGVVERADQLHRRSLRTLRGLGACGELARGLMLAALLLLSYVAGQETRVARLLGTADAVRERAGIELLPHERTALSTAIDDVRTRLGALAFETAWRMGRRSTTTAATLDLLSAPGAEPVEVPDGGRIRTLTARQFQVAMLVGQGMTNRQVAKRLDLSEWTVINHVRQIMRKLDLPSRVYVAQWISQQRGVESTGYAEVGEAG
jgi:non-specific serine/threonine protein kinase